jgi:Ni,Fe-hydrogenase III small subunit
MQELQFFMVSSILGADILLVFGQMTKSDGELHKKIKNFDY